MKAQLCLDHLEEWGQHKLELDMNWRKELLIRMNQDIVLESTIMHNIAYISRGPERYVTER